MQQSLPDHDVVLLGAGHTNAHLIRMWRMNGYPNTRLTCVSDHAVATYSGMLPGTLAGLYSPERMQIDLVRLCAACGVRFVQAKVTGVDLSEKKLLFADRSPLRFDALSIGIGSRPSTPPDASYSSLAIKPMQTFLDRLHQRLLLLREKAKDRPWRITIAGAGAGGVEIAYCLPQYIRRTFGDQPMELTQVDRGTDVLSGTPNRTKMLARRELERTGVTLSLGHSIDRVDEDGTVLLDDGSRLPTDLLLWATSAKAPSLLQKLGLPTDERGFLLTRDTLQSVGHNAVFAVGDAGTCDGFRLPKAGVYAVRQGPVLWENLKRYLDGQPLRQWKPQRTFLTLLNTGDGRSILTYRGVSIHAGWCWRLKDWIDSRFMDKYQDYKPRMSPQPPPAKDEAATMQCGGCGCKLPSSILSRVLRKIDNPPAAHVEMGLNEPDDVALLHHTAGTSVTATVDFFTTFLDDPYLLGRIAALNALSDQYATGTRPRAALALVTVPLGPPHQQEELVYQLLEGSLLELRRSHALFHPAGVPIVGGHTVVGTQTMLGFTVLGEGERANLLQKSALRTGDRLVLTKPIGSGVLLAANMRALCQAAWFVQLLETMLVSNAAAGAIAHQFRLSAATDITGFGLAGHLLEMLEASGKAADISLSSIPLLPGAAELSEAGVESTLAPGNRVAESGILADETIRRNAAYRLLFDPQTSGGLLLSVSEQELSAVIRAIEDDGGTAAEIGSVQEGASSARLKVLP